MKKEVQPVGFLSLPYIRGVSGKFKLLVKVYNIRTLFKMRHVLRNSLTRTRPIRAPQEKTNCVYSIFRECSRSYIGETGRSSAVRQGERMQNLQERHLKNPD